MNRRGPQSAVLLDAHDNSICVDEFDALSIAVEVRLGPGDTLAPPNTSTPARPSAPRPPKPKYPAKLHAQKIAKELGVKDGLIYLPGLPSQLYEDSDMGPDFRQRRYFYYIGGADFEDCAVTYDLASDSLVLWVPFIDPRQVLWYGTSPGPDQCKATIELDDCRYTTELDGFLHRRLGLKATTSTGTAAGAIHIPASVGSGFCREANQHRHHANTPSSSSSKTTLFVLHPDQVPELLLGETASSLTVDAARLQPAMDAARVIKTPYEIDMVRKANDVSSAAHAAVLRSIKNMNNERDVEAIFLDTCLADFGAKHQAYPVIAGSGPNASVLHYFANNEPLAGRQLVCLDAGAEWDLYASDVTRTFPISGKFTPEAEAIYEAVARMQSTVFERFVPGAAFAYLHLEAAYVAAEALLRLGILQGATATDIVAQGTISAFFPHGLGHHVGLEVHDVLSSDLMSRPPQDDNDKAVAASSKAFVAGTQHLRSQLGDGVRGGRPDGERSKRHPVTPQMYAALAREFAGMAKGGVYAFAAQQDKRRRLEPGMIVTVEPGIYFCRPYIESFFLKDKKHAKYINREVLETYYGVGGVRIEDCLLVTEWGYENLTKAPKGEEALRIINRGK